MQTMTLLLRGDGVWLASYNVSEMQVTNINVAKFVMRGTNATYCVTAWMILSMQRIVTSGRMMDDGLLQAVL